MNQAVRSASAAAAAAHPRDLGLSANGLQRLRQVLLREIDQKRLPGAVATIARQGKLGFLEAFGVQEPAGGARIEIDSIFRIDSMTKPIVSVAMMMLVEEGCLFLADPLAKYVPAFADPKVAIEGDGGVELVPAERPITIQDLLRHTSGLTYEFVGAGAVQLMYAEKGLPSTNQTNADRSDWQGCRCSASGPNVRRGSELLQPGHGFCLGFAVRTEPGMSVMPGSVGLYFWGGIAGTTFWIDPAEELYAMMLVQAPGQRDYYRALFRTLVYGALD
jgi:CubicO group peptidase (beta-lactamase class C family)